MKISYNWLQDFVDLKELGLDPSLVSDALASIGLPLEGVETAADDCIFDIDVTSNRPDCLNHLGVARELAAHFRLKLRRPDCSEPPAERPANVAPARVVIEDPDLCPLYSARVMTDFTIDESPNWLKEKLLSVGQRPINNIVDITNYVLLLVGHPLHAFDYEKLEKRTIVVRRARPGETVVTLDGALRKLSPEMLAICDATRPVAVAGVMGGESSEISLNTKTMLLESAYFTPASIRSTSRALGLRTEASYRFERGGDPELPVKALNLACHLIAKIAGGKTVGPVINENPAPFTRRALDLRAKRIRQVVGIDIDGSFVADILNRLEFEILESKADQWKVRIPGFRVDVDVEDDLVEEAARHFGYEKIPSSYPAPASAGAYQASQQREQILVQKLRGFGFYEAVNYVFGTPARESVFFPGSHSMIPISNPLTEEDTHLRTSLVPGLVASVRRNMNYGARDVRLFEIGKVFTGSADQGLEGIGERNRLGIVATGTFYRPYWTDGRDDFRFPHLKGVLEELLRALGCEVEYQPADGVSFLSPGVAASVQIDGRPAGVIGELSADLLERFKFLQKVFVAEIELDEALTRALPEPRYSPLSRFPGVERDLSFVVDKKIKYSKMDDAIKSLNVANLRDVQLIDLYQGQRLPSGKVSLTVRLTFADLTRTLTQDEVNGYMERVSDLLKREFGVEQRA